MWLEWTADLADIVQILHFPVWVSSLFNKMPAGVLDPPQPLGENLQVALLVLRLITIPEVFLFLFLNTWHSFQIQQRLFLHSDLMWNLTKCWRRFKGREFGISSGRAGSVISTPPVWSQLCMSLCVVTLPPSPKKNTLGSDQREVIYLFVGYTKELNYVNKDWKSSPVVLHLRSPTYTRTRNTTVCCASETQSGMQQ